MAKTNSFDKLDTLLTADPAPSSGWELKKGETIEISENLSFVFDGYNETSDELLLVNSVTGEKVEMAKEVFVTFIQETRALTDKTINTKAQFKEEMQKLKKELTAKPNEVQRQIILAKSDILQDKFTVFLNKAKKSTTKDPKSTPEKKEVEIHPGEQYIDRGFTPPRIYTVLASRGKAHFLVEDEKGENNEMLIKKIAGLINGGMWELYENEKLATTPDSISNEVYDNFVDNNIVPEDILKSIAAKIIGHISFSPREESIYVKKAKEINALVASGQSFKIAETKTDATSTPDSTDKKLSQLEEGHAEIEKLEARQAEIIAKRKAILEKIQRIDLELEQERKEKATPIATTTNEEPSKLEPKKKDTLVVEPVKPEDKKENIVEYDEKQLEGEIKNNIKLLITKMKEKKPEQKPRMNEEDFSFTRTGDTFKMNTVISVSTGKFLYPTADIALSLQLGNKNGVLDIINSSIDAGLATSQVRKELEPALPQIIPGIKAYFENKLGKRIEEMKIINGKLVLKSN